MARLILASMAIVTSLTVAVLPAGRGDSRARRGTPAGVSRATGRGARIEPEWLALGPRAAEPAQGGGPARPEFKAAGVCARCHVVSVLEWGISKHVAEATTCRDCHGPSKGHVANERNEVKPDQLPRGAQVAASCMRCHEEGCPRTLEKLTCQKCHHPHALLDPAKGPKVDDASHRLIARFEEYRRQMDRGEALVGKADWKGAGTAFEGALALMPDDRRASSRLALCKRRLRPDMPGLTIVGEAYDPGTGLPREVKIRGLDIPMVLLPQGEVDLGADHLTGSRPIHTVAIRAFYLGKFEVTQSQWREVMGSNPSVHQGKAFPDAAAMPVEQVSWNDCREFLDRLNRRVEGGGFRLPTESEWEYACRAGARQPLRASGADVDAGAGESLGPFAWSRENARRASADAGPPQSPDAWSPRPVGTRRANPWGFFDMQGNVSEWCSSLYRPYPYDPADGRESPDSTAMRVLRGGGFADPADELDPALRHHDRPDRRRRWNGLRLARGVLP